MENMLDICSANSYQQCSRSVCFSGFLRIHHSNLNICVLNSLEIGVVCCGRVRALQRLIAACQGLCCCCSQCTDSSKGLGLVCKKQSFAGGVEALPLWSVGLRLQSFEHPEALVKSFSSSSFQESSALTSHPE